MSDTIGHMADRLHSERIELENRALDRRRTRLRRKLHTTQGELEREREARQALAEVLESTQSRRRGRGIVRLVLIGGVAYLLGARAGRERYDAVMRKVGEVRDDLGARAGEMRDRAMRTAKAVPEVVAGTSKDVSDHAVEAAQRSRDELVQGSRAVGDDVAAAAKELQRSSKSVDV